MPFWRRVLYASVLSHAKVYNEGSAKMFLIALIYESFWRFASGIDLPETLH